MPTARADSRRQPDPALFSEPSPRSDSPHTAPQSGDVDIDRTVPSGSGSGSGGVTTESDLYRETHEPAESQPSFAARVPTAEGNVLEGSGGSEDDGVDSVAALLRRMVVHTTTMIERLPPLHSPELKLIGKRVSLRAVTTNGGGLQCTRYTGLVCTIRACTVVLMDAHCCAEVDVKQLDQRELELAALSPHGSTDGADTREPFEARDAAEVLRRTDDGGGTLEEEAAAGTRATATHTGAPAQGGATETETSNSAASLAAAPTERSRTGRRTRAAARDGPVTALPYVSLARTAVQGIRPLRDSPSTAYALFRDPERHLSDMQRLRVFTRRYLVHTSEGNNQRRLPLRHYVTARCACTDLDDSVLRRIVVEEMEGLLKVDSATRMETRLRANQLDWRRSPYNATAGALRRSSVLLPHTGELRLTCGVSVVALGLVGLYGVWLGTATQVLANPITSALIQHKMVFVVATPVVAAVAAANALLHTVQMRMSQRRDLRDALVRAATGLAAIVGTLVSGVVLAASQRVEAVEHVLRHHISSPSLCAFYIGQHCSGLTAACTNPPAMDTAVCPCGPRFIYAAASCRADVLNNARTVLAPVASLSLLLCVIFAYLQYLLLSYHVLARGQHRARDHAGGAQ
ncbi:hypothetical protein NESM_000743400 [Novymonas esmeraldas]|uniref:Integral membrane protein n=1 Tax=Novymonas esmeraldas TaxID=1808958 RepID=A0AAW0EUG0_9TRYP